MRLIILYYTIIFLNVISLNIFAQWTQKANFAGTPRFAAVGFNIGNKGYIGTGQDSAGIYKSDLWEYDPVYNNWVQKADYPATERRHAVAVSMSNKGYLGTGWNGSSHYKTFKEFNPLSNTWTSKAYFGGDARRLAVGFLIGSKVYIGTGFSGAYFYNDFWEYDPSANTWTQKANVPGMPREGAVGFSIGSKGYIGTGDGFDGNFPCYLDDFWEYDPVTNTWTQKSDFGGGVRFCAVGFSIGSKGYIGAGKQGNSIKNDFWEYDPVTKTWTQLADFAGVPRYDAIGFSIGLKGYLGTGLSDTSILKDFWEFNPLLVNTKESNKTCQLSIFPNPADDWINILSGSPSPVSIEIINSSGQTIKSISEIKTKFNLDIRNLAKGIYYIKVNSDNDFVVKKIFIL